MRTLRVGLEQLSARDNVVAATWKAARGKRNRPEVVHFLERLDEHLDCLAGHILGGTAPDGGARVFEIRDPKRRRITAPVFPDRVLHHAILNLTEARFETMLVESSHACRPGHGVHRAALEVQAHLRRCEAWPWLVQVDVAGYFPSIDHAILKALLARQFKGAGFLALLCRIIDAGSTTPGRGLPIGALTSQHFANAYLDGADRFLLEQLRVCAHVRYMDDIVWWCRSRGEAQESLDGLADWLPRERALRLKLGAHIGQARHGLSFCGFRIRPGVILASSRKLSRYRLGVRSLAQQRAAQGIDDLTAQRAHDSALSILAGTQSIGFRQRLMLDLAANRSYAKNVGCGP